MKAEQILDYNAKVDRLRELAELQDDEMGEVWTILGNLWHRRDYCISPEFLTALRKETDVQLENVEQNAKIEVIEKTETRQYKRLHWDQDDV